MRTVLKFSMIAAIAAGLAACADESAVSPTATSPHAMTTVAENWQVGAGEMRDSEGRSYTVCTLMQTGKGDRRFWIAATPPGVSRDLYIGVRGPELPDTGGQRLDRKGVLTIDGLSYNATRAQQVASTLSMSLKAERVESFIEAFDRGRDLSVHIDDLAGLAIAWPLAGSRQGLAVWRDCISRELTGTAPAATPAPSVYQPGNP